MKPEAATPSRPKRLLVKVKIGAKTYYQRPIKPLGYDVKFLALSDIDHNVYAIRKMVDQVRKIKFDAILVLGDISDEAHEEAYGEIFDLLEVLKKPIYYVLGNHDFHIRYDRFFSKRSVHLHDQIVQIGDYYLMGFSGAEHGWGYNPIANTKKVWSGGTGARDTLIQKANLKRLADRVHEAGIDPRKLIVMSHDRCTKLDEYFRDKTPLTHIHGHRGNAGLNEYKNTCIINTSKLSRVWPVFNNRGKRMDIHAGVYCIISLGEERVDLEIIPLTPAADHYRKSEFPGVSYSSMNYGYSDDPKRWAPKDRPYLKRQKAVKVTERRKNSSQA